VAPPPRGGDQAGSLKPFLSALASDHPVPAGGAAAAAAVAMAAGLVEKSARLSTAQWIGAANVGKRAAVLRKLASILVDADATVYADYVKALRAARGLHTIERERIVLPAHERIVEVPLTVARAAVEVTGLAVTIAEHGNPNLRSDATVAAHIAAAAAQAAAVTLASNLTRAPRDARLQEARRLAKEASARVSPLRARARAGARGRGRARSAGTGRR
jgi:formiminotetrahydrofolate cyclodeaminase